MRHALLIALLAAVACGQSALSPEGKWVSNLKLFEDNNYDRMELKLSGTKLTGKLGSDDIAGTYQNGRIEATVKPDPHTTIQLQGRLDGDRIEGSATIAEAKLEFKWEARREAPKSTGPPQTHAFEPTQFHHLFSGAIAPALHVNPGDSVKTWSVDAGGTDPKGVRRTSGGNPLTGPFYIEGAVPGDALVVHFNRIRLNRDTAISSPMIVSNALDSGYVEDRKRVEGYSADWKLNREAGLASLQKPTDTLKLYKVPAGPDAGLCRRSATGRGAIPFGIPGELWREYGLQPGARRRDCLFAGLCTGRSALCRGRPCTAGRR